MKNLQDAGIDNVFFWKMYDLFRRATSPEEKLMYMYCNISFVKLHVCFVFYADLTLTESVI
jgi:hypothetical protein